MINQDDAEIGDTVWLRASTKRAPRECYLGLAAVLVDVKKEWPMVTVRVFVPRETPSDPPPDEGKLLTVHRMNVGLKPKVIKRDKDGDMVGGSEATPRPVRVLGKPVPDVDPDSGYEQGVLF